MLCLGVAGWESIPPASSPDWLTLSPKWHSSCKGMILDRLERKFQIAQTGANHHQVMHNMVVAQDVSWLQKASCWDGWGLSGRVPISSRKQSELMQLLRLKSLFLAVVSLPWTETPDWVTKLNFVCLTVRPNERKLQSLEKRKFYCRAKQGD